MRMVYARERDWYLTLSPGRDVIELPLIGDEDINGWDIKKALTLLMKPNPVLLEWIDSPIRYRWDASATSKILKLADKTQHKQPFLHHYINLGSGQWRRNIDGKEAVALKKYFYCLRPALCLRWMRMHDSRPPMNFQDLRDGTELPTDVNKFLDELLTKKKLTRELGNGPRLEILDKLILSEFELAKEECKKGYPKQDSLTDEGNELFRDLISAENH